MRNVQSGKTIPAFPNSFPYNELLLSGKLSAKTRTWRWGHTGLTLLYTSTSTAREVASAHGLNPKGTPRGVLVGVGELVPVRKLTYAEAKRIEREFDNNTGTVSIGAGAWRYKFKNLKRFKKPVPFKPPQGAVRLFNVPVTVVARALKEVGVSTSNLGGPQYRKLPIVTKTWRKTDPPKKQGKVVKLRYRDSFGGVRQGNFYWDNTEQTWIECDDPEGIALYEDDGYIVLGWQ
ncbi:MAG: hypothetical protein HYT12_03680 [Candidatus Liptonbacteria bacterium]|nr:hypothetical protein [Candidatus Liptonbacteria bacterium]